MLRILNSYIDDSKYHFLKNLKDNFSIKEDVLILHWSQSVLYSKVPLYSSVEIKAHYVYIHA